MKSYRPPQWQKASLATTVLFFPGMPKTAAYSSSGSPLALPTAQTYYIFDAVLSIDHEQRVVTTDHPVQTGANISDHAYFEPARVSLNIGMSDAMDSYSPGMWPGSPSKSVGAYQTLIALQLARIPLSLGTRLRYYTNMILEYVTAEDTSRTIGGLRARAQFRQILVANTQIVPNSVRIQDTASTGLGTVTAQPVNPQIQAANKVFNSLSGKETPVNPQNSDIQPVAAHGSGNYSSFITNLINKLKDDFSNRFPPLPLKIF